MSENNAVTKEELKEILAEMAKELRAETAASLMQQTRRPRRDLRTWRKRRTRGIQSFLG